MLAETFTTGRAGFDGRMYLLIDESTNTAAAVDPDLYPETLLRYLRGKQYTLTLILLTHGHFDHIGGVKALKEATGAKIAIHRADAPMLTDIGLNLSRYFGSEGSVQSPADIVLEDHQTLSVGSLDVEILHTPGHTVGCSCYRCDGILFSGDTLFNGNVGRCDFPGGNMKTLMDSIRTHLLCLPDETVVYPGHGIRTTIGAERRNLRCLEDML